MSKIYLVTGGCGFLGSHLCEKLVKKKFQVICIDNLSTSNISNIEHLQNFENFKFIKKDIIEPFDIKVDGIFNLACAASPPRYQKNPVHTLDTCYLGTKNMAQLALKYKVKIFHASTSEIYGDPLQHPQKESYFGNVNTFGPRACYDEGKRIAETILYNYNKENNLQIRVGRIFNTYGPNMAHDDGRVVSNFIYSALLNKDLEMYGDGEQTRSFCYVDDLINGIYKFFFSMDELNKPINLGNPSEFTINELSELIIRLTNSKSKLVYKKLPMNDPLKRKPDISEASNLLNWHPKVSLEDGLIRTINYFKYKF